MASSSTSTLEVKYDVFLSFRGEDTRDNFTSHLYSALCHKKIKTYIDYELSRGNAISPSLLNAIEGSKISVIIFSKRYASSRWCLEELVKILECKIMYGQIVIPVFYHIDPTHVRNQTGTFGKAFSKHEVRFKERLEMLQRWRDALTEAANLSGFNSQVIRPESELIKEITNEILKRLNNISPSCDSEELVGVKSKIQKIISLFSTPRLDDVLMVGIWGIGGIGKTTIARTVFNEISSEFESSYFAENVKEELEKCSGFCRLQIRILFTILEDKHTNIGLRFTRERLRHKKVLIVFDDVTCSAQILKLIGNFYNLGSGSRIIITTREEKVLETCGIVDAKYRFKVEGLCHDDALQLFSQYAFKQNYPTKDFMELSNKIIAHAKGVPLALKVLGSTLYKKIKQDWESQVCNLEKEYLPDGIQKNLKISYDGLDNMEKEIFLDIACAYKGWKLHDVQDILSANKLISTQIGLSNLIDKSIITISDDTIAVHDLLQDMGKEIIRQESINPGNRSRLWNHLDIYDVLKNNRGTDKIQGICLDMSKICDINLSEYAFEKMRRLRFFIVSNSNYENKLHGFEGLQYFSTDFFSWERYPLRSLPSKFQAENLVRLEMPHSNVHLLWHSDQNLVNMKHINLSHCRHITDIPNISSAINLQELNLEGCTSLLEITQSSIQNLNKLVNLNLRDCKKLIDLQDGIQSESITLSGCSNLKMAPKISCKVKKLDLSGTAIKESPFIEHPSKLVRLDLSFCRRLEGLSNSIGKLKFLEYLSLNRCPKLENLPNDIGNLEALQILEASGTFIRQIPSTILNLSKLSSLRLCRFSDDKAPLSWVPSSLSGLISLERLELINCQITKLPDNIGQLSSLKVLDAYGNDFESIPAGIKDLSNLHFLNICYCEKLQSLPELPRGLNIAAYNCSSLESISDSSFLFSPNSRPQRVNFANCFKLDLSKVLHKESRREICDTICYPGSEIPEWFSFQNVENFIILEQPPDWHSKHFLGFDLCAVVSFPKRGYIKDNFIVKCLCIVKSKDDNIELCLCSLHAWDNYEFLDDFAGPPEPYYIGLDHVFLGFTSFMVSPIKVLDRQDENYVSIMKEMGHSNMLVIFHAPYDGVIVKKCGIHFLYSKECREPMEESRRGTDRDKESKKDKPHSTKLRVSNSFGGESNSRPQLISEFLQGCSTMQALSGFKLERNAIRDIMKDALLNDRQNAIVWPEIEEMTCENPKGCMSFPGSEIPEWFNIQNNTGCYIKIPGGSFNHNFVGLAFSTSLAFQYYDNEGQDLYVNCEMRLKCEDGYYNNVAVGSIRGCFEGDRHHCINSDLVFLGYDCVMYSHEFHKLSYNSEAIINFYVTTCNEVPTNFVEGCKVKKCGVRLLYIQDFREPKNESNSSLISDKEESDEDEEEEEPYPDRLKISNFDEGKSSSRFFNPEEKEEGEEEEPHFKRLKIPNYFEGESSSRFFNPNERGEGEEPDFKSLTIPNCLEGESSSRSTTKESNLILKLIGILTSCCSLKVESKPLVDQYEDQEVNQS